MIDFILSVSGVRMVDVKPDVNKIKIKKEFASKSSNPVSIKKENSSTARFVSQTTSLKAQTANLSTFTRYVKQEPGPSSRQTKPVVKAQSWSDHKAINEKKPGRKALKNDCLSEVPTRASARLNPSLFDQSSSISPRPTVRPRPRARRRRRKRRTVKPATKSSPKKSRANLGPRTRIVRILGIERNNTLGAHALPTYRRPRQDENIINLRSAAGIPAPSIFGDDLPDFGSVPLRDEVINISDSPSVRTPTRGLNKSVSDKKDPAQLILKSSSKKTTISLVVSPAHNSDCDLLGNILEGQKVLMTESSKVSIQDGTLKLVNHESSNYSTQTATNSHTTVRSPAKCSTKSPVSPVKAIPRRVLRSSFSRPSLSLGLELNPKASKDKDESKPPSFSPFANRQPNLSPHYQQSLNLHLLDSKQRSLLTDILTIDADESSPVQTPLFGGHLKAGEAIWNPGSFLRKKLSMPSKIEKQEEEIICLD